jgi:hypothetical protein
MVDLSPLAGAGWQFFGNNGLPLAGGKLFSYAAGTTTPLATFTSVSGATPHANPIILDSAGRVPSQVWLTAGSAYKFTLKTSADVEIWTKDNISGIDTGLRVDLAASSGSSLVGFLQAGTGAVARTAQAKMRESVSVKDFGAVGDGTTNDSAAVQAAVNYASTFSEGALVQFPAGKYVLASTVTVIKSGVILEGDGGGNTWIINGQTNAPSITFGDGVSMYSRNGVSGLVFGQKSAVTPAAGNCGLLASKCSNFAMENVQVFQFPAALYDGVIFDNVTQSYVVNIGFQNCTNAAWVLRNNTSGIFASNGRCDSSAYGVQIRDCQGLYFTNFDNFGNSQHAWDIGSTGAGDMRFVFFTNCMGDTSGSHNWRITELEVGRFTNCWGSTQLVPVTGTYADGFFVSGSNCSDLAFVNCVAIANNRHGFHIELANRVTIADPTAGANFIPTFAGGLGSGNGVGAGGGSGVFIGAFAGKVSVNGGLATDNQRYGIEVAAGATKVRVNNTETRFNVLGGVLNSANGSAAECKVTNVAGFNPRGFITAPAIPASGVATTNRTGVDVTVYLNGGTLTANVQISGHGVLGTTNVPYFLPAGETITLTYSVAPTWQWSGN